MLLIGLLLIVVFSYLPAWGFVRLMQTGPIVTPEEAVKLGAARIFFAIVFFVIEFLIFIACVSS